MKFVASRSERCLRQSFTLFLLLACFLTQALGQSPSQPHHAKTSAKKSAGKTWHFAASGDSRNCGDIVMPAIAAGATRDHADFYWHLGDFRWIGNIDQDYKQVHSSPDNTASLQEYQAHAWDDFAENQLKAFPMPVFLGIGNHELAPPKTRAEYLTRFSPWLNSPVIAAQRSKDHPESLGARAYYHWVRDGVDFINLDNADNKFDSDQVKWFETIIARDKSDQSISAVVLGMHEALPESISAGHSMNQSPEGVDSGRQVYRDLLKLKNEAHKNVYVLASHSHFFMAGTFNTDYWRQNGGVLPGWIVGTAGAFRYALPPNSKDADAAMTNVYGYLLATVNPPGKPRGTIQFNFRLLGEDNVPAEVVTRYSPTLVHECFVGNHEGQ